MQEILRTSRKLRALSNRPTITLHRRSTCEQHTSNSQTTFYTTHGYCYNSKTITIHRKNWIWLVEGRLMFVQAGTSPQHLNTGLGHG